MKSNSALCEVNRADFVALFEVQTYRPGTWQPDPENDLNQRRSCVLGGRLEVIHGDLPHKDGEAVEITITQRQPESGRIAQDYGPWSRPPLEPGQKLLVFGERPAPQSTVEQSLEKGTQLVVSLPDPSFPFALEDTRFAIELKRRQRFPAIVAEAGVQTQIFQKRGSTGPIMARFIMDASGAVDGRGVEPLIHRLIEAEDATPLLRAELLRLMVDAFSSEEDVPRESRARLARAMIGILEEPGPASSVLKEGIRQSYLRSILFTPAGRPRLDVADVIASATERERVREFLAEQPLGEELGRHLERWLRR